ncbi:radical SAM protein [candidate division KSB1 bacterium]|nr:B12-binding domain-containing radical SAM protein [candidate division KSB1 bacterium]NIU94242.1 radical SAM protein [candidate division KSB1 bacterium]NIW69412.1 radical SAM protein [candidate division KSB1 bacterium]
MSHHVLIINPWITDFSAYDFWLKPLGLLYVGGVLRQYGYHVSLIDCMDRYDPELLNFLGVASPRNQHFNTGKFHREIIPKPPLYNNIPRNFARYGFPLELFKAKLKGILRPEVILVTSGMTYWYPGVQLAIEEIHKTFPDTPVVLGGIYPTLCRDHAVENSGTDFVISGEGELAALQLVDKLTGVKRDYDGFPNHIDGFPYPVFDLYPNLAYASVMTSRGCPLRCTFCASNIVSGAYRWRTPRKVVDELEYYYETLGIREFAFYDDALLTNHKDHLAPILEQIIDKGWDASFHTPNGLQCKLIDDDIAARMFSSGFKTIRLSYESGNPDRQKDMSQKVSNETFARAVSCLYQASFELGDLEAYVMAALPGQTIEEVLWSMAYVHAQGVKIRLAAFSPIPGTVEWERAKLYHDFPEDADPLLSNNTILPIKPSGGTAETFEKINRFAKHLNQQLMENLVETDVRSLVSRMKQNFSRLELWGVSSCEV